MRIAQILTSIQDGGLERTVLQVSSGLAGLEGFHSAAYCLMDHNPGAAEFRDRGIPVRSFGARNRGLAGIVSLPSTVLRLRRALVEDRIDVVVVHDFLPALVGRLSARAAGVPLAISVLHSTYEWIGPAARALDRALVGSTTKFVAVSEVARQARLAWGGYPEDRLEVLHNGIDARRFVPDPAARAEVRKELGIAADDLVVGCVGVVRGSKRQIDLVEAIEAPMRERQDLHLVIVGSRRPHEMAYSRELDEALRRLPGDRIHRLERRPDIPRVLAALDLYAAPSESEGFGLALVEALLCGLPVVASDIGAHREIADGNPFVRFHAPRDPSGLRDGIRHFLSLPSPVDSGGRDLVAHRFSEEAMVARWRDLFLSLEVR